MTPRLFQHWTFAPSAAPNWYRRFRLKAALTRRGPPPASRVIKPAFPSARWTVFFLYLPDGALNSSQEFTLERLRALDRKLLVVCAAASAADIPEQLAVMADAVYWKAQDGYDFSGYAIGLDAVARLSPGAEVFVLNDSAFGPFGDLESIIDAAPWDLTGFTASPQYENHIQSYAFVLRDLTPRRLRRLRSIFPLRYAYNDIVTVVASFETRFARVASAHMTVGSLWMGGDADTDPSLAYALELVRNGFPFLKKSLVGKHRDKQDEQEVRALLAELGHPAPEISNVPLAPP